MTWAKDLARNLTEQFGTIPEDVLADNFRKVWDDAIASVTPRINELEQENTAYREVYKTSVTLVSKIETTEQDPEYQEVWDFHAKNFGPYTGQQYRDEVIAARKAIDQIPA